MRKIALLSVLILAVQMAAAQEETGITSSRELVLLVSSLPEAKLEYTHRYVFPFLQGNNPLTEGNNITLNLSADLTPISYNKIVNAVWTPVAFLELSAGGRIGFGWNIELGGNHIRGIGLNLPDDGGGQNAVYDGRAFDALLWKTFFGAAFQFSMAAIFPGDWNHVVFRTYHEINYHGNTRARAGQAWYFEGGDGENMNGFNYYGNFLIGYQMPIFLNMVAFFAEMEMYLYDTPGRSVWGDDLIRWTFSCLLDFKITEQLGIALIAQWRTRRNFTNFDERTDDFDSVHFTNRILDTSNPRSLRFYRIAAALTFRF